MLYNLLRAEYATHNSCVQYQYTGNMTVEQAINALRAAFLGDQIAVQGTEDYNKLNNSYLSLLQSEIKPAAIFLPRNKHDVAKFVQLIAPFALDGNIQFAIRGAGQQPVPGCSNIEGNGITIDLRHLTGIEIKDGFVALGAGERWGTIYEKLAEQGLGVTGSRSALGGIGGLALAGNISRFIVVALLTLNRYRWPLLLLLTRRLHLRQRCELRGGSFQR